MQELSPEVVSILQGMGIKGKLLQEVRIDPNLATYIQKCID